MAERITVGMVRRKFELFCKAMNRQASFNADNMREGVLTLRRVAYRGFVITENKTHGESHPFGSRGRSAEEMWHTLDFAIDAIRIEQDRFKAILLKNGQDADVVAEPSVSRY